MKYLDKMIFHSSYVNKFKTRRRYLNQDEHNKGIYIHN